MLNTHTLYSKISKERAMRWHRGGLDEWSITDWATALAGEVGELCNAVKKYRRVEDQLSQHDGDTPAPKNFDEALRQIKKEIGDSYAYLDLIAQRFGLDLWECARDTFNQISVREGMPERIVGAPCACSAIFMIGERIETPDGWLHSFEQCGGAPNE